MKEVFFGKEVNEVLSEIYESSGAIYEDILYLHRMTG